MDLKKFKEEVTKECESILSFWEKNTIDETNGGFIGAIDGDMTKHPEADKGSVLNARILWTFSSAYRIFKKENYLTLANKAYEYITSHFINKKNNGVYWMIDCKGNPSDPKNQVFSLAFLIYALVEYYKVSNKKEAIDYASKLFDSIQKYSLDTKYNGYFDAFSEDWAKKLTEPNKTNTKSLLTQLHILESYAPLYNATKDEKIKGGLKNILIDVFLNKIINKEKGCLRFEFDDDWKDKSTSNSYGHDMTASWFICVANDYLQSEEHSKEIKEISVKMAEQCLRDGIDKDDGGMNRLGSDGVIKDSDKHWWVQCESIVGFMNAYQITKDDKFLKAAFNCWEFIKKYIIDYKNGEWYYRINKNHEVYKEEQKVGPWKCPYHNSRMCMQVIERINSLLK